MQACNSTAENIKQFKFCVGYRDRNVIVNLLGLVVYFAFNAVIYRRSVLCSQEAPPRVAVKLRYAL